MKLVHLKSTIAMFFLLFLLVSVLCSSLCSMIKGSISVGKPCKDVDYGTLNKLISVRDPSTLLNKVESSTNFTMQDLYHDAIKRSQLMQSKTPDQ